MSDWGEGYVTEIDYIHGYYPELNPVNALFALTHAGFRAPVISQACELAFGQGVSAALHAAASTAAWGGNDFNPAQATFAQDMAAASGCGAVFTDESFEELCARTDLPDYDFIAVHGIYSWITPAIQAQVEDFIRRKLKAGGILYISYNTPEGWTSMSPVRHLMRLHAEDMGAKGKNILSRVDEAVGFMDQLLGLQPGFARANPGVLERFKLLKLQNRQYIAHEYFNRNWQAVPFSQMAERLQLCKLNFVGAAAIQENLDVMLLTNEQQACLKSLENPSLRESVRDFMLNRQFRKDYWIKGARKLSPLQQIEAMSQQRFQLVTPRDKVRLAITVPMGEVKLNEAIYAPILGALADHQPQSAAQIEQKVTGQGFPFSQIWESLLMLTAKQDVVVVQDEKTVAKVQAQTQKLNTWILDQARSRNDLVHMASPLTGGGVSVQRAHQLFLLSRSQGKKTPEEWASAAWKILAACGHRLMKDGKTLQSAEENQAELLSQAQDFAVNRLPILKALKIA